MKRIYLACPYSHWNPLVRIYRWLWASWASHKLIQQGYCVFSPLSHSVPISWFQSKKDNCHNVWLKQDLEWLEMCHEMCILDLKGWRDSTGVAHEIERGKFWGKPIQVLHPKFLIITEVLNE